MNGLPKRYSLAMQGYVSRENSFWVNSQDGLTLLVKRIAKYADMKLLSTTTVDIDDVTDGQWNGLSALALIATSHIAIHLWPSLCSHYMLDLVSCKPFDPEDVKKKIEVILGRKCDWSEFSSYEPGPMEDVAPGLATEWTYRG